MGQFLRIFAETLFPNERKRPNNDLIRSKFYTKKRVDLFPEFGQNEEGICRRNILYFVSLF